MLTTEKEKGKAQNKQNGQDTHEFSGQRKKKRKRRVHNIQTQHYDIDTTRKDQSKTTIETKQFILQLSQNKQCNFTPDVLPRDRYPVAGFLGTLATYTWLLRVLVARDRRLLIQVWEGPRW